ncbi:Multidrug resistance protein mrp-7 [Aphelenchoides besseyi]|nr:Multidrug resistance protein mrp-7 [Aphelenchoides besseyi]
MAEEHDAIERFCGSSFWYNDAYYNSSRLPNLTPCFQETVLVWTPSLFFWILAPIFALQIRIMQQKRKFSPLPLSPLLILNLILTVIAFLVSIFFCVKYFFTSSDSKGAVYFWSPLIRAITMAGVFVGQLASKRVGLVSSGIIFNTFFLHLICSLPELYLWIERMNGSRHKFDDLFDSVRCVLFFIWLVTIVAQTAALCFANRRSQSETGDDEKNYSPELNSSFLNRITLWWFNRVPILGSKKDLEVSDLFELNRENKSEYLVQLWEKYWTPKLEAYNAKMKEILDEGTATTLLGEKAKSNGFSADPLSNGNDHSVHSKTNVSGKDKPKLTKPSVVYNLFQMFKWQLISAGAVKSIADILQFANPFLLQQLLKFVSNENAHLWEGISYAVLMFVASELRSLMVNWYFYIMFRMGSKIQISLTGAVYKKTLRLSNSARRDRTVGEIVNVMAIDVERFQMITSQIQQYWSSPFQITLALIFLFNTLGIAALPGVFIMVIFIPLSLGASVWTRRYQTKQMKLKDERTKLINEILNGIKVVKLYAWEVPLMLEVEKIRKEELRCNMISSTIRSFLDVYNFSTPFLVALFSFMTYTLMNPDHTLTPQVAFVSLTLFNQLRSPMTMVGLLINMTVQAIVSNRRIKDLLVAEEIDPNAVHKDVSSDDAEEAMKVKNGDFAWDTGSDAHYTDPTLQDVNVEVKKGALIAVVGRVGAGKSSLLSALLGEMTKLRGYVGMHGQVAYVPQQPWIQNMTLRNNICFGRPFNQTFYNKVINMCALKSDLEILQQGDQTEIGEKGINLSGGQKARVSLARAVYQNADLYLFDDPLSAVDSHVGKHIFDKVIGPKGILRNKTRILVTHGVTFLPDVDLIVHIDDGRILEMGSYAELMMKNNKFAKLITEAEFGKDTSSTGSTAIESRNETPQQDNEFDEFDDTSILIQDSTDVDSPMNRTRQMSTVSTLARRTCSIRRNVTPPVSPPKSTSDAKSSKSEVQRLGGDKLIQAESIQTGRVKKAVYLIYMRAASLILSILFAFFYVAYTGFQLGRNIWLSEWSDANDPAKSAGDKIPLSARLGFYAGLGVSETLSFAFAMVCMIFGSLRASKQLHGPMLQRILEAPMAFFDTTPIGRILNRFGKDVDVVDTMLPMNFRYFLMCITQVTSTVLIVCISTPVFIVVAVVLIVIYVYALKFYVPTSRQLRRLESNYRSPIYSHFSESIQGVTTIRAFNKMDTFCKLSDERVDTFIRVKYLSLVANRWLGIRLELLGNLVTFFAALFAALSHEFGFVSSAGLVGLSVSYALNITETMNFAGRSKVRQVSELETNIVSVERLKEYSEVDSEASWVVESNRPPKGWPSKGAVVMDSYATRYRPGLDLVVKNINAEVPPAQKIGIVGRTGAGKSSLTLALFRIIEPAEGRIVIDGVDISQIGLHDLRSGITIIPQDFASNLPDGLNHKITEGGDNISVGQRQLVCLARALLRRSKILVLDEATAAVDVATDALIQETIRREFADATIFTIAHRLNTIVDYDRVMVLDAGEIREFDNPRQLLSNPNSLFSAMAVDANLQS